MKEKLGRNKLFLKKDGDVFLDGSCDRPRDPVEARAAWAVVQLEEQQLILAAGQGTVAHGFKQSPIDSEQWADLRGAVNTEEGAVLHLDFAAVLAQAKQPY